MKKSKWDNYKFHCSSLPCLMTKSRNKSEPLSETAKAMLREIWIKEKYGRVSFGRANKFTEKGLVVEQDSLKLVTCVLKRGFLAKNRSQLSNDYVTGTPDVVAPILIDIKSSWDIWTFAGVDSKKAHSDYYWQLFGYMWMLKKSRSKLIYALVNTPDNIKEDELYRLTFKNLLPEEIQAAERNYIFDDIREKQRVKVFNFSFDKEKVQELCYMIEQARIYLKTIKL